MLSNKIFSRIASYSTIFKKQRKVPYTLNQQKSTPKELLWKLIENKTIRSSQDWKNVRKEILNNNNLITPANIDAMTMEVCTINKKYNWGLSYVDFLKEDNIKLNLATIGKSFKLLYQKGIYESLSQDDQDRILTMYDNLRESYPVLDSLTLDSVVQALSLTEKWELCSKLLDEIKVASSPSPWTYSAVVAAAFMHRVDDLAWAILNEMLEKDKAIMGVVYTSYFKRVSKSPKKVEEIERLFQFMQENSVKVVSPIEEFIESLLESKVKVASSDIYTRGICKHCNQKLQTFKLCDDEFNELKTKIIQNVIVGKDVFNRSTEEELETFKKFAANMGKFDVIIDGLNVAYSAGVLQPPQVTSGLVASVVNYFVNERKKVLVLGRKHMNNWPRQNMKYIQKNAELFLTENLSQDDPYLLYCALNSGKDTIIVTRDLMRSHKFLLRDVRLKLLFERWLSQRQYILLRVQERGQPVFKKPLPFSQIAQKINGYWHIPYVPYKAEPTTTTHWLCIQL